MYVEIARRKNLKELFSTKKYKKKIIIIKMWRILKILQNCTNIVEKLLT